MRTARPAAEWHQQPTRHGGPDAGRRAVAKKFGGFHRREQRLLSAHRDRGRDLATLSDVRAPTRRHEWIFATSRARRSEGCRGAGDARERRDLKCLAHAMGHRPVLAILGGHRAGRRLVCQMPVLVTSATHSAPVVHRRSSVAIARRARHGVNDGGG
jgi:hypothetical protein